MQSPFLKPQRKNENWFKNLGAREIEGKTAEFGQVKRVLARVVRIPLATLTTLSKSWE